MNQVTNFMEVQFTAAASNQCSTANNGLYSCVIRHSVVGGVAVTPDGVQDFAVPVTHASDDVGCKNFITTNLLSSSEFSTNLAVNMTRIVREKFGIDNYMKRAWYINPGYQWPTPPGTSAQSVLSLTDKMIAVAVVSMRNVATGVVTARRLVILTHLYEKYLFDN